MLLAIAVGSLSCAERELSDDGMEAEPTAHPPALLERHEEACDEWCGLVDACGLNEAHCSCVARDFSEEHVLCVEKATLRLECKASLTCEVAQRIMNMSSSPQDEPCIGEGIAESLAC